MAAVDTMRHENGFSDGYGAPAWANRGMSYQPGFPLTGGLLPGFPGVAPDPRLLPGFPGQPFIPAMMARAPPPKRDNERGHFAFAPPPPAPAPAPPPARTRPQRRATRAPKRDEEDEDDEYLEDENDDMKEDPEMEVYEFDESLYPDKLHGLLAACQAVDRADRATRSSRRGRKPKVVTNIPAPPPVPVVGVKRSKNSNSRKVRPKRAKPGEEEELLAELAGQEQSHTLLSDNVAWTEAATELMDFIDANEKLHSACEACSKMLSVDGFSGVSPDYRDSMEKILESNREKLRKARYLLALAQGVFAEDGPLLNHRSRLLDLVQSRDGDSPS